MATKLDKDHVIEQAVRGLQAEGATEVYVFGSYAEDRMREGSDLDLAVRGITAERWYLALAKALQEVPVQVDVIDLDRPSRFASFLMQTDRLHRVA